MSAKMRLFWKVWAATILLVPAASQAATCTPQAELSAEERSALSAVGGRLAQAVVSAGREHSAGCSAARGDGGVERDSVCRRAVLRRL